MRGSDPSKGVLKIISAREISHSQRGHQSIDTANNQITNVPESNHQEHQQCQILLILFQPPRTRGSYDEKKKKKQALSKNAWTSNTKEAVLKCSVTTASACCPGSPSQWTLFLVEHHPLLCIWTLSASTGTSPWEHNPVPTSPWRHTCTPVHNVCRNRRTQKPPITNCHLPLQGP